MNSTMLSSPRVKSKALEFWGLKFPPFENLGGTELYFPAPQHAEAIARASFAVQAGKAGVIILGGYGVGKSFVKSLLAAKFRRDPSIHVEVLDNVLVGAAELLGHLLDRLIAHNPECGADVPAAVFGHSPASLQDRLSTLAEKIHRKKTKRLVLMLDEMQLVKDPQALEQIRLLMNVVDPDGLPLFTFMIFGQESLMDSLRLSPSFLQRISILWTIKPFNLEQTAEYIRHRLHEAGAQREIFEPEAIERIHEVSRGLPRSINNLCDLCMHFSHVHKHWSVSREMVDAIAEDVAHTDTMVSPE